MKNIYNFCYRTHTCGEINKAHIGKIVSISGWLQNLRNLGNLLFFDLRDQSGIIQVVVQDLCSIKKLHKVPKESVLLILGKVQLRSEENINHNIQTGEIELELKSFKVLSKCCSLPFKIYPFKPIIENLRWEYRYLELRRKDLQYNIFFRSKLISEIRKLLNAQGFIEFHIPFLDRSNSTNIDGLTNQSKLNQKNIISHVYYLNQFRVFLAASGFDKYFLISPGFLGENFVKNTKFEEHLQLHIDMSFVTQNEVIVFTEKLLLNLYKLFSDWSIKKIPFPKISYDNVILKFGCTKPDLRIPVEIYDILFLLKQSSFHPFLNKIVRVLSVPNFRGKSFSNFDWLNEKAKSLEAQGLVWMSINDDMSLHGPIVKIFPRKLCMKILEACQAKQGYTLFLLAGNNIREINRILVDLWKRLGNELDFLEQKKEFNFCWIIDFPMFESDDDSDQMILIQNALAMPKGRIEIINSNNPMNIKALKYELVCNGIALGRGMIINHCIDTIYQTFKILGYDKREIDTYFEGLIRPFKFGFPPHGEITLDLDRITMQLLNESDLNSIIAFKENKFSLLLDQIHVESLDIEKKRTFSSDLDSFVRNGKFISNFEVNDYINRVVNRDKIELTSELASLIKSRSLNSSYINKNLSVDKLNRIKAILPDFNICPKQAKLLLNLFPTKKTKILNKPLEDIFGFFWSILGNKNVGKILTNRTALKHLTRLIQMKVITDYKQISFIYPTTLQNINYLLKQKPSENEKSHLFEIIHENLKKRQILDIEKSQMHSLRQFIDSGNRKYLFYFSKEDKEMIIKALKLFNEKLKYRNAYALRKLLSNRPNDFSTIVKSLVFLYKSGHLVSLKKYETHVILEAAKEGLCTPILFLAYKHIYPDRDKLNQFRISLQNLQKHIFPNTPIDPNFISMKMSSILSIMGVSYSRNSLKSNEILAEIIYFLFRPANMDIDTIFKYLNKLKDCTRELKWLDANFSPPYWDSGDGCFKLNLKSLDSVMIELHIFPTKNIASFFSRASAGICTATDIDSFRRRDHFHLNLVDAKTHQVIGNVQAYLFKNKSDKALLLRAINVSTTFITKENAPTMVRAVLLVGIEIAKKTNVDVLYLSEPLGIWHANSSRPEILGILEKLNENLRCFKLEKPFYLYSYGKKNIFINNVFQLWRKDEAE